MLSIMETVQIFWDPSGMQLDTIARKPNISPPNDGDTPYVKLPIRMLGIDTPETSYPTVGNPSNFDDELLELADELKSGKYNVNQGLIDHLVPRLETGTAGTLQKDQGEAAKTAFTTLLDTRLSKAGSTRKRTFYMKTADQAFDHYGRLLAYIAPNYSKEELNGLTAIQRATFNLNMLENGWASSIMIYPNLPKNSDLRLARNAVKNAVDNNLGAWADSTMLTGYEWRMCVKMYKAIKKLRGNNTYVRKSDYVSRYCMDMTTLKVYYPDQYYLVKSYNRIFIWENDIRKAVSELNLKSAD